MLKEVKREVENGQSLMGMISVAVDPNDRPIVGDILQQLDPLNETPGEEVTQAEMGRIVCLVMLHSMDAAITGRSEVSDELKKAIDRFLENNRPIEKRPIVSLERVVDEREVFHHVVRNVEEDSAYTPLNQYFRDLKARGMTEQSVDNSPNTQRTGRDPRSPPFDESLTRDTKKLFGVMAKQMAYSTGWDLFWAPLTSVHLENYRRGPRMSTEAIYGKEFHKLLNILVNEEAICGSFRKLAKRRY